MLGDSKSYDLFLSWLSHELGHAALIATYNNYGLPYYFHDEISKREFTRIVELYRGQENIDIIEDAYEYKEEKIPNELIPSVFEIITLFFDKDLEEVKSKYEDLFIFYQLKTKKDLERELRMVTIHQEVQSFNEDFGKLQELSSEDNFSFNPEYIANLKIDRVTKFFAFISTCPKLTLHAIYQNLLAKYGIHSWSIFIFADFGCKLNKKYCSAVSKESNFKNSLPILVLDCSTFDKREHSPNKFFNLLNSTSKVIFVTTEEEILKKIDDEYGNDEDMPRESISHSWFDLKPETRQRLLDLEITFQEESTFLYKIFEIETDFNLFDIFPTNKIVNKGTIIIDPKFKKNISVSKFYSVQRKLIAKYHGKNICDGHGDLSEILEKVESNDALKIMNNDSGAGKSTTLAKIAEIMKATYPGYWIIYIELPSNEKLVNSEIYNLDDLMKALNESILKSKSTESIGLFNYLFKKRHVVILFDGYNELLDKNRRSIINILRLLATYKVWITTDTHLNDEFSDIDHLLISIKPFAIPDQIEFIRTQLGLDASFCQIIQCNLAKLLSTEILQLFEIPQNLKILVDIHGTQLANANLKCEEQISNLYEFYDKFTNEILDDRWKRSSSKQSKLFEGAISKKIGTSSPQEIYRKIAICIFFGDTDRSEELQNIESRFTIQLRFVGLTKIDSSGRLQFIHETYFDFFVVDHVIITLFINSTSMSSIEEAFEIIFTRLSEKCTQTFCLMFEHAIKHCVNSKEIDAKSKISSKEFNLAAKKKIKKFSNETILEFITTESCNLTFKFITTVLDIHTR